MKEGGAHAVKLEGGERVVPHVEALVQAGIPVMAHLGFTPQSEHAFGGYRVQGRGDAAEGLIARRPGPGGGRRLRAGPGDGSGRRREAGHRGAGHPDDRHRRGPDCDAQVLVWQDMAGLRGGKVPRFVKKYADLRGVCYAARDYADDVRSEAFPTSEHSFT